MIEPSAERGAPAPPATPGGEAESLAALFAQAADASPGSRDELLDRLCAGREDLRPEIDSLLAHHAADDSFLESPMLGTGFRVADAEFFGAESAAAMPGDVLGAYRIVALIGSGGMSRVYRAMQDDPAREVALKVLRDSPALSRRAVQRFREEAAILARLRHEGIAQVYQLGVHQQVGGRAMPYIAMELIPEPLPVTVFAQQRRLPLVQRLRLFIGVCDAVHHGHQRGIIHRDLKPSNILVGADGRVKVIDFGVAHITNPPSDALAPATREGELIGTPAYMSPEQLDGAPGDIDVRADVYSLGLVLYELVCGRPPVVIPPGSVYLAARAVREKAPTPPSRIDRALRGDVETIILKALEKERGRRYQSAADLAQDLRRFLERRPILARRASVAYRCRLLVRRNPAAATAALLALLALAGGIGAVGYGAVAARRGERSAQQAVEFFDEMLSSAQARRSGDDIRLVDLLAQARGRLDARTDWPPAVEAQLRHTLGRTYEAVADYASALVQYEAALKQAERVFPADDPRVVRIRIELAGSWYDRGDFGRAAGMLEQLLGSEAGRHDALVEAKIRNDVALAYINLGRLTDAAEELRRSERMRARELGPEHHDTAQTVYNLGVVYYKLRDDGAAEASLRAALAAAQADGAESAGLAAHAQRFLALCLCRQGRTGEARACADAAVEAIRARVGEAHPNFAGALLSLGEVAEAQGDAALARESFARAAEIYRAALGPDHLYAREAEERLAAVAGGEER